MTQKISASNKTTALIKPHAKLKPRKPRHSPVTTQPIPDAAIQSIATLLANQISAEKRAHRYAPVRDVLSLLGKGAVLSAVLFAPKSAKALKPLIVQSPDYDEWKRYNISYLQRTLKRLYKHEYIDIIEEAGIEKITLTHSGKQKILKYSLEALIVLKPKRWDGKWRLVLYDIPKEEGRRSDLLRQALKSMGFYAIQKSVYLNPYPCFEQIDFLRLYYDLSERLQYMVVEHIEHDEAYKTYFGLT